MDTPEIQGVSADAASGPQAARPAAWAWAGWWEGIRDRFRPRARPGFWPRLGAAGGLFRRPAIRPAETAARCVVVGPVSSGKTALLYSLARCAEANSHSYHDRFEVHITGGNADFETYYRGRNVRDRFFREGLALQATQLTDWYSPEFRLEVHGRGDRAGPERVVTFTSFDGSGGLLLGRMDRFAAVDASDASRPLADTAAPDAGKALPEDALKAALTEAESVILCIPLAQEITIEQQDALARRIYELRGSPGLRHLVICFTMYEKLGKGLGRSAYRHLATRAAARRYLTEALGQRHQGVAKALRAFRRRWGKSVWCIPVSTYGFIPGNGGINYDPDAASVLTRSPATDDDPTLLLPYRRNDAWALWHPFCTLDPFIFIATGDWRGTLVHNLKELGH